MTKARFTEELKDETVKQINAALQMRQRPEVKT